MNVGPQVCAYLAVCFLGSFLCCLVSCTLRINLRLVLAVGCSRQQGGRAADMRAAHGQGFRLAVNGVTTQPRLKQQLLGAAACRAEQTTQATCLKPVMRLTVSVPSYSPSTAASSCLSRCLSAALNASRVSLLALVAAFISLAFARQAVSLAASSAASSTALCRISSPSALAAALQCRKPTPQVAFTVGLLQEVAHTCEN